MRRNLPELIIVDLSECDVDCHDSIEDAISDYLSNTYCFCHKGFSINYVDGFNKIATVSNIKWDTDEC